MLTKALIFPCINAFAPWITSSPFSCGIGRLKTRSRLSSKLCLGRSWIPIVRSPCTFECPRTGEAPAPSTPIIPMSNSRLVIMATLSSPWTCWVMPMPHVQIVAGLSATSLASSMISALLIPQPRSTSAHDCWRNQLSKAS